MRDEQYRSKCFFTKQYDATIDWIIANNPYAKDYVLGAEMFACQAVHGCIDTVLKEGHMNSMAGMCLVVRVTSDENSPVYNKVYLGVSVGLL